MPATMAKKKKKQEDRHASSFLIRLPEVYRDQLRLLRQQTRRAMTEEAKIALESHLASHDLWPPKGQK
jgi:hypothetical protein